MSVFIELTDKEVELICEELSSRMVCNTDVMWDCASNNEGSLYRNEDYIMCAVDNAVVACIMSKLGKDAHEEFDKVTEAKV